jgi:hypothetical protein
MNATPPGALTWESAAERNRRLKLWQRGLFAMFGEQGRTIRLAWVLANLFNTKTGYCYATNTALSEMTMMAPNKVQATMLILEQARAIVRGSITHPSGRKLRVIYPATGISLGYGGTPNLGVGGDPQQPGAHTLSKRPRLPRTELERARLAATIREQKAAPESAAAPEGHPSSEATCQPVPHTTPEAAAAKAGHAYNGRGARARYEWHKRNDNEEEPTCVTRDCRSTLA